MKTEHLWQQRLLLAGRRSPVGAEHDSRPREARLSAEDPVQTLLTDLRTGKLDKPSMVALVERALEQQPAEHRRTLALLLFRTTRGEGEVHDALEAVLARYV